MHVVSKKIIPFAEPLIVYESMKNCEQFGGTLAFTRTEEEYKEVKYLYAEYDILNIGVLSANMSF